LESISRDFNAQQLRAAKTADRVNHHVHVLRAVLLFVFCFRARSDVGFSIVVLGSYILTCCLRADTAAGGCAAGKLSRDMMRIACFVQ